MKKRGAPAQYLFKPGVSGNPGGVPKGKRISTWLLELGEMHVLPDPSTLPINGRIALARLRAAMAERGDRSAEFVASLTESKTETIIKFLAPEDREAILQKGREIGDQIEPTANA